MHTNLLVGTARCYSWPCRFNGGKINVAYLGGKNKYGFFSPPLCRALLRELLQDLNSTEYIGLKFFFRTQLTDAATASKIDLSMLLKATGRQNDSKKRTQWLPTSTMRNVFSVTL
jgi:hypothetical protein